MDYRPEGFNYGTKENTDFISSVEGLRKAKESEADIEVTAVICTSEHDIIVDIPCGKGIIPRMEGALGIAEGTTRDIALISRVNKIVRCRVMSVETNADGTVSAVLSRKASQSDCMENYVSKLKTGDIIDAKITHIEHFGAFVDIGCGISSLIPIDSISVSRISQPSDRFFVGQNVKVVVRKNEDNRIYLTHKELLGTWEENASHFNIGETVSGIVRSVEEYGVFVELAPNLAGLAEPKNGVAVGEKVSVYIKAVIPEKMKIKLIIVDTCGVSPDPPTEPEYFINGDRIREWQYSPASSNKVIKSLFV